MSGKGKGKEKGKEKEVQNKNEDPGEFLEWALQHHGLASDYLSWAKQAENVKVTSVLVPEEILPKFVRDATVHDVRVFSKKRVPDDKLYSKSKQLRDKVARGNFLLSMKIRSLSGEIHSVTVFLVFALRKFTGGMGDDDDADDNYSRDLWKDFFLAPEEKTTRVISTVKENGAAAHLAAFKIYGETFLIAGSKNVHLIVRKKEDLSLYKDERFKVAKIVAETVLDQIESIGEKKEKLLSYLCETHYTASFELIDPADQHVELIDLPAPELRFIAFSSFWESSKTICIDPMKGFSTMKEFGMKVIGHDVYDLKSDSESPIDVQLEPVFNSIRKIHGSEGRVIYFLDKESHVIGLLKKKSAWYIILRALREKSKSYLYKKDNGGSRETHYSEIRDYLKDKIRRRIKDVQKWLNFSQENLQEWIDLGLKFNDWLCQELIGGGVKVEQLGDTFPVIWNQFLKETGLTDQIEFAGSGF